MQKERFLKIIEYLKEHRTATFAELADITQVSVDTVRRDVEKMDREKLLRRVRGGAVYHNGDLTTQSVNVRKISSHVDVITNLLSDYIVDGQAIALNSGNTCTAVAEYLAGNYYRLTVITNNLEAIKILSKKKDFTVIVPGGIVDTKEEAIYGESCEKGIRKYNIDVAILGVYGISLEKGITDFRYLHTGVMKAMLESAAKKIILADKGKFCKVSYVNVCGLKDVDLIICNDKISDDIKEAYKKEGVQLILPDN